VEAKDGKPQKGKKEGKKDSKKDTKKAEGKGKVKDSAEPAAADPTVVPALAPGESHLVGEAAVRLRDAFDARRTKGFCWYSLADVSKGGAGVSAFAGQVGLNIETVDFSAARMPKPPPQVIVRRQTAVARGSRGRGAGRERSTRDRRRLQDDRDLMLRHAVHVPAQVAHVECQTDLAQQRAAQKAMQKLAEGPLPRKKSRFAEKMGAGVAVAAKPKLGLNQGYGWSRASKNGITTPRSLLPTADALTGWRQQVPLGPGPDPQPAKPAPTKGAANADVAAFRSINSKYQHLFDFDAADGADAKGKGLAKPANGARTGQDEAGEADAHWLQVRDSIDVLMGVPAAQGAAKPKQDGAGAVNTK